MFHIFIASCFEGINYQVPRIINNILDVQIPLDYVHIIVGGCPEEKEYYINGVNVINVKYRCFEFTPLIFIVKNENKFNFDYAFFTHDTVIFGKKFYNIINNYIEILKNTNYDTKKIEYKDPSMNIGIYTKKIILKNKDKLLSLECNSNEHDILYSLKNKLVFYEDFILNQNCIKGTEHAIIERKILTGINNISSKNSLIKYYKDIDFTKYQSNANIISTIDICKIE